MTSFDAIQAWFFRNPLFGTLLFMMCIDIILGLLLSVQEKRVSSDVSRRGMTRKAVMLLLVMVGYVLSGVTGIPGTGATIALFFITSELISVLENGALLGAPIPPPLIAILLQLRPSLKGGEFRLGDSTEEHARILAERELHKTASVDPSLDILDVLDGSDGPNPPDFLP